MAGSSTPPSSPRPLPGRTTVFDSPYADTRSGRAMLPAVLESHAPVDPVILMFWDQ